MGRCEAIVRGFVCALCIACLWCVVTAQSGEDGQPNASPVDSSGRRCVRYWWTSMWGFVTTLVVLTMDTWGLVKVGSTSIFTNVVFTIFTSVLNPLMMVFRMSDDAILSMAMVSNLRGAPGKELVFPLYPGRKSKIKILVGAKVVVNLSLGTMPRNFKTEVNVKDLSEAIVVGTKVEDSSKRNVQLSYEGMLALLRADILPPYDQLKFLRGNSTLGMIVAAAQAIGYIYAIGVRRHQGLQVSPIEAIACFLNIVVLMKVVLHNFASLGHRPLLLYLTREEETKFILECNKANSSESKFETKRNIARWIANCIAIGTLSTVVIYFIVYFKHALNGQCIVPIVLFQVSLVFSLIVSSLLQLDGYITRMSIAICLTTLLNAIGYTWALVVSFKYWKEERFDVQSSNYLSQVLPYIG